MHKLPDWPVFGLHSDLLGPAKDYVAHGESFALATLVRCVGPSPRPLGSEMLIGARGGVHGYVSGGCVEAAVVQEALACIGGGSPRLLDYGRGSEILDIQLTCGGRINVFVRRVEDPDWWISKLRLVRNTRRSVLVDIDLATGGMQISESECAGKAHFVKRYAPCTRLFLVGSDPVTLATAQLARSLDMEVFLWRPDGPGYPPPGIAVDSYLNSSIGNGLDLLTIDPYTAFYCLSHDPELDVRILQLALPSQAFCVGVLGSRSKLESRRQALMECGLSQAECGRLRSPAGLAIGAKSPQEIALSILTEVVSIRHDAERQMGQAENRRPNISLLKQAKC